MQEMCPYRGENGGGGSEPFPGRTGMAAVPAAGGFLRPPDRNRSANRPGETVKAASGDTAAGGDRRWWGGPTPTPTLPVPAAVGWLLHLSRGGVHVTSAEPTVIHGLLLL